MKEAPPPPEPPLAPATALLLPAVPPPPPPPPVAVIVPNTLFPPFVPTPVVPPAPPAPTVTVIDAPGVVAYEDAMSAPAPPPPPRWSDPPPPPPPPTTRTLTEITLGGTVHEVVPDAVKVTVRVAPVEVLIDCDAPVPVYVSASK